METDLGADGSSLSELTCLLREWIEMTCMHDDTRISHRP
jgi:hypothetical protein